MSPSYQNRATNNNPTSDIRRRAVTALALIPFLFGLLQGGMIAGGVCIIIGVVMAYESVTISTRSITHPFSFAQFVMVMTPAVLVIIPNNIQNLPPPAYVLGMVVVGLAFTAKKISAKLLLAFLALCLFSLVSLLMHEDGLKWLLLTIACVVAADSAAYFGGRRFGGPRLIPIVSPSKTWSGAICGIVAGGIAGYFAGILFGFHGGIAALAGLCIADLSIGGDLLESWFKRSHDVKDSGRILPGHGGFLDRFDGYLLVIPALYLLLAHGFGIVGVGYGG
jgi:phosphatidate cytidylyltransferase